MAVRESLDRQRSRGAWQILAQDRFQSLQPQFLAGADRLRGVERQGHDRLSMQWHQVKRKAFLLPLPRLCGGEGWGDGVRRRALRLAPHSVPPPRKAGGEKEEKLARYRCRCNSHLAIDSRWTSSGPSARRKMRAWAQPAARPKSSHTPAPPWA